MIDLTADEISLVSRMVHCLYHGSYADFDATVDAEDWKSAQCIEQRRSMRSFLRGRGIRTSDRLYALRDDEGNNNGADPHLRRLNAQLRIGL